MKCNTCRVLVTGGFGFIGSHLVKKLNELGHDVINFNGDITKKSDFNKIGKADVVFHLAAETNPKEDCNKIFRSNVLGTINVLEYAKKCNAKLVFSSSAAVYGNGPVPMKETQDYRSLNAYALSKEICEKAIKISGVDAVILRLFNVYGPGEKHKNGYASIISQFIWKAKKGKPIVIYGNGEQARDFICVKDVVGATILAMEKGKLGEIYNVGTGKQVNFSKLARYICELLSEASKPFMTMTSYTRNPCKGYQYSTLADTTKLRRLGFTAKPLNINSLI